MIDDGVEAESARVEDSRILDNRHDLAALRQAVRDWTRQIAPPEKAHLWLETKGAEQVEVQRWWMRERNKVGLATPHWPAAYGGSNLSLAHQVVIVDEFARTNAPQSSSFTVALNHTIGTLAPFGSCLLYTSPSPAPVQTWRR